MFIRPYATFIRTYDLLSTSAISRSRLCQDACQARRPQKPRLVSFATAAAILIAAQGRCAALLDAIAHWGEAQDLTWIE
jgi:hypothetical protein